MSRLDLSRGVLALSKMKRIPMWVKSFLALIIVLFTIISAADELPVSAYKEWVDETGNITLPNHFRQEWTFLGTWSIAEKEVEQSSAASGHGAAGLHNVYTQPGVVDYFKSHGSFPDGAMIIKELLAAVTTTMTTGTVSRADAVEGWFVMVKDTEGRFSANPLWGDGWGWVLFDSGSPATPVTKNYKTECLGCHIPAREDDWIYLSGYPELNE